MFIALQNFFLSHRTEAVREKERTRKKIESQKEKRRKKRNEPKQRKTNGATGVKNKKIKKSEKERKKDQSVIRRRADIASWANSGPFEMIYRTL